MKKITDFTILKYFREARFAEHNKTEQEEILRKLLLMDEEKQKRISAADERVRKEQVRGKRKGWKKGGKRERLLIGTKFAEKIAFS